MTFTKLLNSGDDNILQRSPVIFQQDNLQRGLRGFSTIFYTAVSQITSLFNAVSL